MIETLLNCSDTKLYERFVYVPSVLRNYSSNVQYIIHVPEGYEVRYKIWRRDQSEYEGVEIGFPITNYRQRNS